MAYDLETQDPLSSLTNISHNFLFRPIIHDTVSEHMYIHVLGTPDSQGTLFSTRKPTL